MSDEREKKLAQVSALIPVFKSAGPAWELKDRGQVYPVELDRDTDDFGHLRGEVIIDGKLMVCLGVWRHPHGLPHYTGERIGLLCVPAGDPRTDKP